MKTFNKFIAENISEESSCLDEITDMIDIVTSISNDVKENFDDFDIEFDINEESDNDEMSLAEIRDDMKEAYDAFFESLDTDDESIIEEKFKGMARRFKKRVKLVGKQIHKDTHSRAGARLKKAAKKSSDASGGFQKMNSKRHLESMSKKYNSHMKKSHSEFWHKFKNVR